MIEPFKLVGHLIAIEKDGNGNVIGEIPVGEMTVYASRFGDVKAEIEEMWPRVIDAVTAARTRATQAPPAPARPVSRDRKPRGDLRAGSR